MGKQVTIVAVLVTLALPSAAALGQTAPQYGFGAQPQVGPSQDAGSKFGPTSPPSGYQPGGPGFPPQVQQGPQQGQQFPPGTSPQFGSQPSGQLGISLVGGVWTGSINDGGMMAQVATEFRPDGTYMSIEHIPQADLRMQVLGRYNLRVTSPTQGVIEVTPMQWLPQQVCNQARQCQPFTPPSTTVSIQVMGQDSVQTDAGAFQRGPVPDFAQAPVPQVAYLGGGSPQ